MTDVNLPSVTHQLDRENPWPGLDPFEEVARDFFHGRDGEAAELLQRVDEETVIVLFGKSGLGKTSLLKAGLFSQLRERHCLPVYIRLEVRPASPPFIDQIQDALRGTLEHEHVDAPTFATDETLWEYLHRADLDLWDSKNYPLKPVLVLDQFEEVFTLGESVAEAVQRFRLDFGDLIENRIPESLTAALNRDDSRASRLNLRTMSYKVLVSLREDFLPDLEGWRRASPALGRVRVRILPMQYRQAMSAVFETAPHLMDKTLAARIVRFVAAEQSPNSTEAMDPPDLPGEESARGIEPALLSLFCRGLNERRKQQSKPRFDDELLDKAKQGIISDYYRSCIEGLPDAVSKFVENELITEKGFRNSYAKEDAVPTHLMPEHLDRLISRRLLRLEERYGTQRIELTHDLLTRAVREHRDWRRAEHERAALAHQAEEQQRALAEEARRREVRLKEERRAEQEEARQREVRLEEERRAEREKRLETEARTGRRFKWLAVTLGVALVGAVLMALVAIWQSYVAQAARDRATQNAQDAKRQQDLAMMSAKQAAQLLEHITNGIRMKQAVLAGDHTQIQRFLASNLANHDIQFTARAQDLGYRNLQGQRVYKFFLNPIKASLPHGESSVAVMTYRMDHPTFQNTLLTTGPDREFTASYTGWGCLDNVVVLIEYVNPDRSPEITAYNMCKALGWEG